MEWVTNKSDATGLTGHQDLAPNSDAARLRLDTRHVCPTTFSSAVVPEFSDFGLGFLLFPGTTSVDSSHKVLRHFRRLQPTLPRLAFPLLKRPIRAKVLRHFRQPTLPYLKLAVALFKDNQ
jgi:hypothetical protein